MRVLPRSIPADKTGILFGISGPIGLGVLGVEVY